MVGDRRRSKDRGEDAGCKVRIKRGRRGEEVSVGVFVPGSAITKPYAQSTR